jgi:hypothetical protein
MWSTWAERLRLHTSAQRWGAVRSAKRCRRCILGLIYSANSSPRIWPMFSVEFTLYEGWSRVSNSGTPASYRQNKASPEYNDDISFLISQYLISDFYIQSIVSTVHRPSANIGNQYCREFFFIPYILFAASYLSLFWNRNVKNSTFSLIFIKSVTDDH